ncbi:MAG: hypothetical protein IKX56_01460 [Muribaculaceae bacterium]|nr:hypothetical protein [Muribaculaceae bacterium]
MKKFSLLILSIVVAISAMAGASSKGQAYRPLTKPSKAPARVDIITEQPEGTLVKYVRGGEFLTASLYGYAAEQQQGRVKVVYADDGKTVYIKDPLCYAEGVGAWVHGELSDDGSTITVPLGQYVSYNEDYGYGLILAWGSTMALDLGGFYWVDFYADESVTEVTYAVDAENGTITLMGGVGDAANPEPYNYEATGLAGVWDDDGSMVTVEWSSIWTEMGEITPAVPADPEALDFFDCGDESGYTRFDFNINLEDVDGNPLDTDCLTYSIFTDDDQLFVFDTNTYGAANGFDTDMTEIPYGYSGEDFYLRRVYFYRTNVGEDPMFNWRIGIQVNYTIDGVTNKSDIVYLEVYPKPTALDEVNVGKSVASVRYFNIAGQEVAQPNGLTIQVTTYSDGTTSAAKVIK